MGLERRGVVVLGQVKVGFVHLQPFSPLGFAEVLPLAGLAFIVTLVVMVQTAATTRSFSGDRDDPDVNRDYIGIGVAGLLAGLVGAFPVNASPPRTAAVTEAGGRSQYSGLFAVLIVALLAAFGTRLLTSIPVAALGGILLFVAQRIFHLRALMDILRRAPSEGALALLTAVLILVLPIQTGVAIGIFLSLAHGVYTTTRVQPILFERVAATSVWWPALPASPGERQAGVIVMGFQAPLSFLNAGEFRRGLLEAAAANQGKATLLVLEASSIVEIDFTASGIVSDVIARTRGLGMDFAIARLESVRAQTALDRFGVLDRLGRDHLFHSVDEAIRALAPPPSRDGRKG